ncbi:MAG: copper homeostasis protein CutC [Bacteroidales bacterium]|nr:copper homeostasis protein CutC [Bacteroidales bacterium]
MILEICANSVQSAINAQKGGAQRIELCQNLNEGGTTPSYATIEYCAKQLKLKTFVLIRPRIGDFCYSDVEFEIIKKDVAACKKAGVSGVVVGFLHPDLTIDVEKTAAIVKESYPMEVTFHRAFDICKNWEQSLEQIIEVGCHRLLTSGQKKSAFEGMMMLKNIVQKANGRIQVMAGSGVNSQNALEIITKSGVQEIHASCKKRICQISDYKEDIYLDRSNLIYTETDIKEVEKILKQLKNNKF